MQDKVFPYSREEDNIWYTWTHFYSNLEVHGGMQKFTTTRQCHLNWEYKPGAPYPPRITSLSSNRCLIQVHTKPQTCLVYEIWQDHSLKEEVCNTLWQWLTWVLIEMGRNVETLHIWAHEIGQFSSQKPPSFIAAAGVETYELIWKMLLLVLMGATTLHSFNYTVSCCVSCEMTQRHTWWPEITVMNYIASTGFHWKMSDVGNS